MVAKQGSEKVKIAGVDDKRQISVVLAGSLTGELLSLQLVYQGKTKQCLPKVKFTMTGSFLSHLIIGVMRLQWRLMFAK